ncbi:hypothetical protein [Xenorhabdus hominickii]|uniref:Uncharacterized protein n=1 Tax=Xenorhabdus hominickii TaxID=351679 RepID=A0A1V0M4E3_XENHO|nr:hypothetical protein [Xenorhabdus hominickii]ARD69735.1 hypothetical protein [Xenorhabdus hominickii]PHM51645.1 hypothetical protein Xhom_04843 [Xenorhabdus hominickii]
MSQQIRITLSALKVAEFASEETTCFEAKVIAIADNDGSTNIRATVLRSMKNHFLHLK